MKNKDIYISFSSFAVKNFKGTVMMDCYNLWVRIQHVGITYYFYHVFICSRIINCHGVLQKLKTRATSIRYGCRANIFDESRPRSSERLQWFSVPTFGPRFSYFYKIICQWRYTIVMTYNVPEIRFRYLITYWENRSKYSDVSTGSYVSVLKE